MKNFTKKNSHFLKIKYIFLILVFGVFSISLSAQNCTVNAGGPESICENDVLTLHGTASGLFAASDTLITWSQIAGPSVSIVSPHSLVTDVIGIVGGQSYTFRISTTCDDGSLVFQDVVKTGLKISSADAGPDQVMCPGSSSLSANSPGSNETGKWTIAGTNNGISITTITSPTSPITVDGNKSGVTNLVWTITNSNDCSDSDTLQITNKGGISPVDAGANIVLDHCYSTTKSTTLAASEGGAGVDGQIGTWTVVSGPNVPTISNIHNNTTAISNLIEGVYVLQWDVVGTCASGSDQDTITVPPATSDVTDASGTNGTFIYCDGRTEVVLNGTAPQYTNETVLWTKASGPAGVTISNSTNNVATVSGLDGSSNYSFDYVITNNATGCSSSATVNIEYATAPSIDITPASVELICGQTAASIPFTSSGDGAETWSIISGPTGPVYTTIPTSDNQITNNPQIIQDLSVAGTYIVRFKKAATVGSQCEAAFDDVQVIVSHGAEFSNAGTDQFLACNIFHTSLAGNEPTLGSGTWSQVSGPGTATFTNIYQYNSPISFPTNGTYVMRWAISNGPFCDQNEDDVEIIVASTTPNQAVAGPDQNVCVNTPVYLLGNSPILNEWGYWEVIPAGGGVTFVDSTSASTTVNGLAANSTYEMVWTIENACGVTHDTLLITTNSATGPIVANAGVDICLATDTTSFNLNGNNPSPGTGTWTQVNGTGATIANSNSATTGVTVSGDGTYFFEWAIYSGACTPTLDTVRITIAPDATVSAAGPDQEICGSSIPASATMAANTPIQGTGTWIQISGSASTITNPTSPTTTITGLIEGVYKYSWLISNEACSESADTVVIYISAPPVAANAGFDQNICNSSSTTLAANTVSNGLWTVISGPNSPTFSDVHLPTATVSNLLMGSYVLRWTSYGGPFCTEDFDEMTISLVPAANAGADQEYCEATTSVNLAGNANSTGAWTQVGTTPNVATITTTSGNTATASGLITGTYSFQFRINSAGCNSTDTMTVTLLTPPGTADAGTDNEYCDASTFSLIGNTPASGITGTWTLLYGSGGTFSPNATTPNTTFTPTGSKYGLFVFGWELSNGSCSNTDQVRIENFEPPSTAVAGTDQTLTCDTETQMAATDPLVGLGTWSLVSQSGGTTAAPTIVSPILFNSLITNLGPEADGTPQTYVFQWTVSNGSLCVPSTDQVSITVYKTPTTANAGVDQELCNQPNTTMAATAVTTGSGTWSQVSGPNTATITSASSETTTITGFTTGTYVFEWLSKTAFCESRDSVTIINYAEPSTPIDLADFAACQFGDLILDTDAPTSGTGLWTQTAGTAVIIIDPTSDSTRVVGVDPGNSYTFRWTVSNGVCADKFDDVTVTVNPEPVASDLSTSECSSAALNIDLLAQVTSPVGGTGVTFSYTVLSSDETNVPAAADRTVAANANITDTYINTTNTLVYISYTVTPISSDGCEGFPFVVDVTINPEPDITNKTSIVCSGDTLNYSLQNLLPAIMRNGTFIYTVVSSDQGNVPAGTNRTVANGNNITDTYTNTTNSAVDITYSVTPTSVEGCSGNNFDLVVTVNPEPVETDNLTNTVCSDEIINITLPATDDDGLTITGYNISANVDANLSSNTLTTGNNLSGVNVIQNDNFNNITSANHDVIYNITPLAGSCAGVSFTVTITVQPEPVLTSGLAETLCADPSTAQATSNLSLTIVNTLPGTTFAYGLPTQTGGMTGGSAGTANPVVQTFTNNTTQPQTATFSVVPTAPNGCAGNATNVVITVNPAAQVDDPGTKVFCNNNAASVTFTTQNTVGTTTYAWTNNNTAIGLVATGNGNLSFTATNAGTSPISANVTVTPTFTYAGQSCPGTPVTFAIVINPTGQVNAISDQELCNNTPTTMVSFSTVNTVGTTTYSWTNSQTSIGLAAIGTGNIPSFTATNIGTDPVVATIVVTPHFDYQSVSCDGPTETFTFTVNPTPVVSSESELSICTSDSVNYIPTSNTAGTTFAWTASNTVGTVTGFTASGSGPISDVLTNAGGTDGKVVYVITPTGPAPTNCVGPDFYLEVTVVECNPIIGVAKQLVSLEYNVDGTSEALFNIRVQNYGNLVLENIQVTEDLTATFGATNYSVLGLSSTSFDVNTAFTGVGNLLDNSGTTNTLAVGASTDIQLRVSILSDGTYSNTVTASSITGGVSDVSQDGSDPDPDGDVLPGNNSVPTPIVVVSCDLTASDIVNTTCNNSAGEVILTGSVAGTVSLNGVEKASPATYTGLQAGWYNATFVATATGCISSTNFEITNSNSDLAGSVTFHKDVSCNSGSDGAVTVTATGGTEPYNYKLNGAVVATNVLTNLMAGEYGLQIADDNGCTYTVSFDIDEPIVLVSSIVATNVSCDGGSDGTATVDVTGGTTPYSYLWDDAGSQITATATGLDAATLYTVTITDDNGCQTSSNITLSAETCDPIAVDDNVITPEDTPVSGDLLANDSDPDGGTLTVTQFILGGTTYTIPSGNNNTASIAGVGDLEINSDGTYTFTPVLNYNGNVPTAIYTISNGIDTDSANLDITVTPVDDLPVVADDSYTTAEDVSYSGDLGSNDTPSGDGGNVWSVETDPTHGTVVVNLDGTFTYTPEADYTGADSFTYKLCDADGDCDTGTVDLTVSSVNDDPVAVDDFTPTAEDTPVDIYVVSNDNFGGDGPSSSAITIITPAVNGTAVVNNNGTANDPTDDYIEYTPDLNFEGNDSFVYQICDSNGDCDQATAVINVNGVDDSPVAVADTVSVTEDNILNGDLAINDTISGDGGNVWSVVTNPTHGTVVVNLDGTYTYTPDEDYNGPDSFTYKLCDGDGSCSTASVTLTVDPDNDPPIVSDVPKTGPEDTDVTFLLSDFTSKFADVDGDAMTQIEVVTLPLNGTLNLSGSPVTSGDIITITDIPNLTFTPDPDWNGETSFDWNGFDGTDWALLDEQVNITITPANDPPVAGVSTMASQENPGGTNNVTVLANSFSGTDIDGTIASLLITSMPSNATSITVDGITYTTIPGGGISVATTSTGQPLFDIEIDPIDGAASSVVSYYVVDNEGLSSVASGSVTVPFSDVMTINAGADAAICSSDVSYTLAATATNYASLLWTTSGTGTFNSNNIEDPVYTPSAADIATGEVQLTLTGTGVGGEIVLNDMMVLSIWPAATAEAGPDAEICSGSTFVLSGATASNYSTLTWSSAGGTFDNLNALNPTFTPSTTGAITINLATSGLGTCSVANSSMVLTVYPPIVLTTPVVTDANCDSQEDGSVILAVTSGGTSPYTYELSIGESITHSADTATFSTLAAGGYVYWVTDANGCTAQGSFEVDDPNELELTVYEENDVNCFSDSDGSLRVEATGGTAPYIYSLGATSQTNNGTFTNLTAGIYVVTVTDANGCSEIETIEIEEPTELDIVLVDIINPDCDSQGQITVNGVGGIPPYTFTSSSGSVSNNIVSALPAGLDTIAITDNNGCVDTLIIDLQDVDQTAPTFTCLPTDTLYSDVNCEVSIPDLTVLVDDESDNCSGSVTMSQNIAANTKVSSDILVTVTATDVAGNFTECDVLLVVLDTTSPEAVCNDITLNLDMTGTVHITPEDVDGGSNDNCGLASMAIDVNTFTCEDLGANTVVLTVTDDSGNTSTCEATVTIEDNIEPILDCPAPETLVADASCQAAIPDFATALSSNNCGTATVTQSPTAGTMVGTGVTTVTITATDGAGNTSSCTTTITVVDETAPTFTCPGTQTLYSDANCEVTIPDLVALVTDEADNCSGTPTVTQSIAAGTPISSDVTVSLTASDAAGNTTSCDVLLVVQDTILPSAVCKDITLNLDMTGTVHISPEDVDGGSFDNCGLASLALDVTTFTCEDLGAKTVVLTVTDDAGNTSSCNAIVTIADNIAPILDCPAPITLVADGNCGAQVPDFAGALSSNNCGSATISQLPLANTIIGLGMYMVTITAIDASGNATLCTTTITVLDQTPPNFTCPGTQMLYSDVNCQDTVPDLTALITDATDSCTGDSNISIEQSVLAGSLISSDLTVTVTVSDSLGNSAECDVLLMMQDTTPPTAKCKDITLQLDMTGFAHISPEDVDDGSFDNCGLTSLSIDVSTFTCDSIGDNPVVLTVTDDAGNTSTCIATVTIEDNVEPILDCPSPVTLIADENCQAPTPDFASALSNNNCGSADVTQIPLAGTPLTVGITIVTVVATDLENNSDTCFTAVTVIDETAPTFTCPETQMLYSDINCQDTVPDLTAIITDARDNCTGDSNINIEQSVAAGTLISSDLTVTVTVSDSLGNRAFCDVLLVMQDTMPPTAVCKPIEVQLDMTGWVHITPEDIDGGSFDNCGLSSMAIDLADFDCTQIGTNNVVLTLTDDADNISTCNSTVTIIDNVDPILDCPAPITLNANSRCVALVPDYSDALSNNNCGNAVITQSPIRYTPIGLGEHIITITATDDAGNTDVCTTTVTVIDVTPPTFTCPETVTMGADSNCEARVPFLTSRISDARDNCGTVTLSQSIPGNTLISNDITVTVTATDNSGNSFSCDVLVRVRDDSPPVATCKDITLQLDMTGQVYISPEDVDNGSYDNCGISSLSLDIAHFDCSSIGENIVYLTVTDDAGNISTCFSRVTIEDNIDPILDCPAPVTLSADENCQAVIPDFTGARSTNNCGTATITQNPAAGTLVGEGVTIVTVIATDSEGNTTTCVTTVTVVDDTAPTFNCPENQKLYSDENCEVAVPDLVAMVTANDNCSSPIVSQSVEPGTMIGSDLTVTVTATDVAGNVTRCDVLLEVRDTTPPTAICKDITLNLDMTGTTQIGAQDVNEGSFDNCGLASMAIDVTTFTCDNLGENSVVLTVTDDVGNISTCTATVTIEDNIDPILDCPAPLTLSADANCQAAIPDFTSSLSSNNCGTATITQSILAGTLVAKGVTIVTITATDEAGNTAECEVNVTVVDTIPPAYTCPSPLVVNTDEGECFSDVRLEIPGVNDNCDSTAVSIKYRVHDPTNFVSNFMDTTSLNYKFVVGVNQVEWIITDQSGNVSVCLQEVEVSEKEAPVITCPEGPFVFSNTIGECGFTITDKSLDAFAIDNCSEVVVAHNYGDWAITNSLQGATFPVGVTTVTWTATDAHGNTSSCSIDITVTDNQTPEFINCPSGSVFNVGLYNGKCEGGAIWSVPVATDNCSEVTVEQTSGPIRGTALAVGEYQIQYTATDGSGNKSYCNFTVNVTDTEDPVIVCQPDLIKENDFGECSWTSTANSLSPLLANSNCPASVSWEVTNPDGTVVSGVDDVSGYVFDLGTSTVHYYIIENVSGQDGDCSFTVTVTDVEAPTLICQPALQVVALPGDCSAEVNLLAPEIIDNCSNSANEVYYTVFSPDGLTSELNSANNLLYEFKVGNNRVEWMVADEAGNVSFCWQDVWIVGYEDEAAVSAGQNVSVLETGSFTVSGASAPDYAMVSWSSSGSGQFINAESVNTTYIPSATDLLDGFVVLTITSSTACTSVSDQMVLSFYKAPVVSAGVDAEICETDVYQLTGSIISDVASVEWYVIGTGTLNDKQIVNPIFTPSQEDIEAGVVNLVFVGKSSHTGLNSLDTMTIHISRQPIISAGEDAWLCKSEPYLLASASLQFGRKVVWTTSGSGVFDDKTLLNATYFPSEADVLNGGVVLTVSNETEGTCASVSDDIVLNIENHPTANAGQDRNTCFNQPIQIDEASAESFSSVNWSTNGGGTIANANTLSPIYTPAADETGTVIFTMQVIGENGCTADTVYDDMAINIYPLLVVDAGDDETIFYNSTTMLSVSVENGSGSYYYNWYPAGFVFEPNANYTETIELPRTIEFNVIVTDANTNCTASDIKTVYVDEDAGNIVSFYSGFSPNHDGVNDTWSIKGIEKFPKNEVMFFNRWGDKVNEYQDYDNKTVAWDGTNNRGKPLPDGTYYYIVTLKDVDSFTGWVHIRTDR